MEKLFNLKNKTAIVTGARRGIGKGIAEVFASAGANVVISDIDLKDCEKTAKQISKKYRVKTLAVECDVSNAQKVTEMVDKTVEKFGRIDILVNNAGIFFQKPFMKYTEKDWDKILDVNLKGIYLCTQAVAKHMIKKKYGKIINISSIAGFVGYAEAAAYCASKGGIVTFTKELALELAPYKINVNSIAPGAIETPMTDFLKENKKAYEATIAVIPLKRMGKPHDIGNAALFLAADESSYVTGHTLVVDGGWLAS